MATKAAAVDGTLFMASADPVVVDERVVEKA